MQRKRTISDLFLKEFVPKLMSNLNLLALVKLDQHVALFLLKSQEPKELVTLVT
jgi:hypothetical protein